MNEFFNSEPYIDKIYNCTCRDCGKEFTINAQCHPKTGFPVSFISKYCEECNMKLRDAFNTTIPINVSITNTKVPQKNVEGLENTIETLATSIVNVKDEFGAFKKHIEHDIEHNKNVVEDKLYSHNKRIDDNKLNLDVIKSTQNMINERHFNHIKKLTRESMIMFFMVILLFVFDLATIWCYIRK